MLPCLPRFSWFSRIKAPQIISSFLQSSEKVDHFCPCSHCFYRGADIWRCLPCCFGSCPFYLILGRIKRPLYLECKIQFWKPKIKVSTGLLFLKPSRKSLFPCLFQFLEATYISWLWPIAHITPSSCLSHCIY